MKKIKRWMLFLGSVYLLSWLLKGVFLSVYVVPSGSMSPTIMMGDYVVVGIFPWRFRTPEFYPLLNIPFPSWSARGPVTVRRGDVVAFSSPLHADIHPSRRMTFVKRVTGMPGDTLTIADEILAGHKKMVLRSARPFGEELPVAESKEGDKMVIVPHKGQTIPIHENNLTVWKTTIKRDGAIVDVDSNGNILINNYMADRYTFKQDFYFMTGDDVQNTSDSRHWGVVPEDHMIGKALWVIWSSQTDQNLRRIH